MIFTVLYLLILQVCIICLQDDLSVSTYIIIILYDTKDCDIIHITNTRHQKLKGNSKEIFIYLQVL